MSKEASKLSRETEKVIEKNIEEDVHSVIRDSVGKIFRRRDPRDLVYVLGFVGPLLAVIQAAEIFITKTALGVSLLYWGAYLFVAGVWFSYGLVYRSKPLIVTYGMWIIVELVILNGIVLYG